MNTPCLNERDLILLHYGEAPESMPAADAATHLRDCAGCRKRQAELGADLAHLPQAGPDDPAAGLRVTAKVRGRLRRSPPRRWLPVLGGTAAAAAALAITLVALPPRETARPAAQPAISLTHSTVEEDEMPDLDFLEEYELLEELEFLEQLEGV